MNRLGFSTLLIVAVSLASAMMQSSAFASALAGAHILVFSKTEGFRHESIPAAIEAFHEMATQHEFTLVATEDSTVFADAELFQFDAIVFLLTTGDVLNEGEQAGLERYMRFRGGFVGVHSAADTEWRGDWTWFRKLVGGVFKSHPKVQPAKLKVMQRDHPATAPLPDVFWHTDEWYDFTDLYEHRTDLLTVDESTYSGGRHGDYHPIAWCHEFGGGRSFYTGLGHTVESYSDAQMRAHLLAGLAWVRRPKPEDTELWEPVPPVVTPSADGGAPSDAIVLFAGDDASRWQHSDGSEVKWRVEDGALTVVGGTGDIETRRGFGDIQLHLEWRTPAAVEGEGQGRGNSGVFLQGRYEMQILDSFENRTYSNGQAASVYKQHRPMVNASRPAGAWQSYDLVFRAPRFAASGELQAPAHVTLFHNGVLVHSHVEIEGTTTYIGEPAYETHDDRAPLVLQDHGNPVSFRNIWVRELDASEPVREPDEPS